MKSWLTDGRGKKVYLSDAIIIMTSNLGSDNFKKFEKPSVSERRLLQISAP